MTDSHTLPDPWRGPGRSWSTFLKDAWRLATVGEQVLDFAKMKARL